MHLDQDLSVAAMDLQWIPPASRFAIQDDRASSPSPSGSPNKRQPTTNKIVDPLLSYLSPSSTLEALQASTTHLAAQDALQESIATAFLSQRSFAIRAAKAAKRLKDWHDELRQWQWQSAPNPFELPPARTPQNLEGDANIAQEYWGSLPAQHVLRYEQRTKEIRDAIDGLQLNDLKMHVRDAHSTSNQNGMDDFTAIVTTTVMQALPIFYRLETLLSVWESRLIVLRESPEFIALMDRTQRDMITAWSAINSGHIGSNEDIAAKHTDTSVPGPSIPRYIPVHEWKTLLGSRIRDLGQRLDYILDTLEGRMDTAPDRWINQMDQLEVDFGDWAVEAEKATFHADMEWGHDPTRRLGPSAITHHPHVPPLEVSNATPPPVNEPSPSLYTDGASGTPDDLLPSNGRRPLPLDLHQHRRNHSNTYSDISSYPGSATSDYFSDMSSPELQDASRAEYFGVGTPVEVTTPGLLRRESMASEDTITRQSSQCTEERGIPACSRVATVLAEPILVEEEGSPAPAATNGSVDSSITRLTGNGASYTTPDVPARSRHRFEEVTDLSPTSTPVKIVRRKTDVASTPKQIATASASVSTGDSLEARITSILTDIPANIRLARSSDSYPSAMTVAPAKLDTRIVRKTPTPRFMRAQTAAPPPSAMTLTPADQKTTRARNGELDVQLYHLHQSDHGPPIKLFVRLVGEGERVMVRIGGGWADLAEYLKEYAIHHGRRTVSGGQFDFQGLPRPQSSSPVTALSPSSNHQTPERTTTAAPIQQWRSCDASTDLTSSNGTTADGFRPTSRDSNVSSRHSWTGDESPSLGLAGPKSRKAVVSPNKQAWVDTMIENARNGSSEKKKGTRDVLGDMGIIGGTRRLFMKKTT
ncbi:MAG: hypothetical protein Q9213_001395 [Squamulea squamosa]